MSTSFDVPNFTRSTLSADPLAVADSLKMGRLFGQNPDAPVSLLASNRTGRRSSSSSEEEEGMSRGETVEDGIEGAAAGAGMFGFLEPALESIVEWATDLGEAQAEATIGAIMPFANPFLAGRFIRHLAQSKTPLTFALNLGGAGYFGWETIGTIPKLGEMANAFAQSNFGSEMGDDVLVGFGSSVLLMGIATHVIPLAAKYAKSSLVGIVRALIPGGR